MSKKGTEYTLTKEAQELKEKLKEITHLRRVLKAKQSQIEEAERNIAVSNSKLGSTPVQGGITTSPQERFMLHIEKLYTQYNETMEKLFALEDEFGETIQTLAPNEQAILIDRYLNGKTWRVISCQYHYSDRQPKRIEAQALNKLAKKKC